MGRFPLRLRFTLAKGRLFPGQTPIRYLRSEELLHAHAQKPVSHEAVREFLRERHSIVWIGGSEPLAHPAIGHLTRLIAQGGHFTFVETDAIVLRQRIHEFQPLPRFYFVVRFLGTEAEHDRCSGRPGAYRAAIEGIRAAQLSGFFICGKLDCDSADSGELAKLYAELVALDLDGWMTTAALGNAAGSGGWNDLRRAVEGAREASVARPLRYGTSPQARGAQETDGEEVAQIQ